MADFNGGFGGGFNEDAFNTTNQFDSPGGKTKKDRRIQRVTPVTAKMIQESEGETMVLNGAEVGMVTVVGIIQDIQIASTKITYIINDGSGNVEAVKWVEEGKADSEECQPLMENTYARLVGTIKTTQGKHYLLLFTARPITDFNRITTHMLETVYYDLKLKALESMGDGAPSEMEGGFSKMDTSTSGPSNGQMTNMPGLSGPQSLVFQVIQLAADHEAGCHRNDIHKAVRGKVSEREIGNAIEFLSSEGHIYSTVDDDTFKATDS